MHASNWKLHGRWVAGAAATLLAFATAPTSVASASTPPTYDLSHFAGLPGTEGTVSTRGFYGPEGVAVSAAGDVYVADTYNNVVTEITPSGQMTVVAGGGATTPAPGTTISATSARLIYPQSLALDSSGNLYIADYNTRQIDKVTPSGQLSVVAGGGHGTPTVGVPVAATSVALNPLGVAVDSAGNLYIADYGDSLVEKVTPAGQLSVIAGDGSFGATGTGPATSEALGRPTNIAVNAAGDVYFADFHNETVDQITPSGQLTIVAGVSGLSGTPSNGIATQTHLDGPWGVALDAAGNLYISDYSGDSDVYEVTPAGELTVIAGNGTSAAPTYGVAATGSSLNDPDGLFSTAGGRLYIADTLNNTIDLLLPASPASTAVPTISGTVAVGSTLTASEGSWSNDPIIFSYQWQDCDPSGANCTNITGATASAYTVSASDQGYTLRVVVTAQNGAGPASADSTVSALLPAPSPPAATATTTTVATTAAAGAGAATRVRTLRATLSATVEAHTDAVSYAFQYGTSTSYGSLTPAGSLAPSITPQTVTAFISRLTPGTVYHFRLQVTNPDGSVSYGPDQNFRTPKARPIRVLDHTHDYWQAHAPYHYRVVGHLRLTRGLTRAMCRTHGKAVITVEHGKRTVSRRVVRLSSKCTYTALFTFSTRELPGTGRIMLHMRFTGNRQLLARTARSQQVFYGPRYRMLHTVYKFTAR